jgi:hypothetical protein
MGILLVVQDYIPCVSCLHRYQHTICIAINTLFVSPSTHYLHSSGSAPDAPHQEEYRREGLGFKRVDFVNNDATVALLDGTGGIFRTLEDVCRCVWVCVGVECDAFDACDM